MLLWCFTRLGLLVALFSVESVVVGDLNYFRHSLAHLGSAGLAGTLVEYPVPAVGVVAFPWVLFAGHSGFVFGLAVMGLVLVTDAVFTWQLRRASRPGDAAPQLVWLLAVPALGAVTLARFDILPGVLVGFMILAAARRPGLAGWALAVATAVKLWPALLLAPLLASVRRRSGVLTAFVVVGAVSVAATVLLAGWPRVFSPLRYQSSRGLQIESLAATPAMLAGLTGLRNERIFYAASKSWEVSGAGTSGLLLATGLASIGLVVFLAALWWRCFRAPGAARPDGLVWSVLAGVTGFVALGRVFSPQYLLWLAPAAAAGLVVVDGSRRALLRWSTGLLLVMVATHAIFPELYRPLIEPSPWSPWIAVLLVVRNVGLGWLFLAAAHTAWRVAAPGPARRREDGADVGHADLDVTGTPA